MTHPRVKTLGSAGLNTDRALHLRRDQVSEEKFGGTPKG